MAFLDILLRGLVERAIFSSSGGMSQNGTLSELRSKTTVDIVSFPFALKYTKS
jgi:hypothetical protein